MISIFSDVETTRHPISYNALSLNLDLGSPSPYIYEVNQIAYRTVVNAPVEPYPDQDGLEVYDARKVSKLVQISGVARAPTMTLLQDMAQNLSSAFDPGSLSYFDPTNHGVKPLSYTARTLTGYENRFLNARPMQPPDILWNEYMGLTFPFALNMLAPDPRAYTLGLNTLSLPPGGGVVTVGGNYPTWPTQIKLTMTGSGSTGCTLTYNSKVLRLNLQSAANGDIVIVYPNEKTATINGVRNDSVTANVTLTTAWWQLVPGSLTVTTGLTTSVSSIELQWYTAWSL